MKCRIDKAGRVVIPAPLREEAGFRPGMELEVAVEDHSIRLYRSVSAPELVRLRGRLVVRPTAPREEWTQVDVRELIEGERDRWPL